MSTLTWEHRVCRVPRIKPLPKGLDAFADTSLGMLKRQGLRAQIEREAQAAEALSAEMEALSTVELLAQVDLSRQQLARRQTASAALSRAVAVVREVAARKMGMRPYFVQLLGMLALHHGYLAEMATGEGKSLTAALAAVLAGWQGKPCHVITVNDYLAQRDARKFEPLFSACGLTAGSVSGDMSAADRQKGYAADLTYTTSKEVVADFLRDRLCLGDLRRAVQWKVRSLASRDRVSGQGIVMRGLHTAIVDEADSVLIDEAVTPLIIAGPGATGETEHAFHQAWSLAARLRPGLDYKVDHATREIDLLPPGAHELQIVAARWPALWRGAMRQRELLLQSLNAKELFVAGKQYVVHENEVVIVDEFSGRMMPMRKWRHGLHQAIEAKEGVPISQPDDTLARLSFQRFFRLYKKLAGMTGTGDEARNEFWSVYRLPVVKIPPNRPNQRKDLPDRVFNHSKAKWTAVVEEVEKRYETGQPVLIGTRSITSSEMLAERLKARGLKVAVLNATRHGEEAEIVASAGQWGQVTIATNMAGRGTDIELGPGVREIGGLHVIATERHESARIDRQLFGRAGRQGDPGSAQAFISADDELLKRFAGRAACTLLHHALQQKWPAAEKLAGLAVQRAQAVAQRRAFQARCAVLAQDDWLDQALAFAGA